MFNKKRGVIFGLLFLILLIIGFVSAILPPDCVDCCITDPDCNDGIPCTFDFCRSDAECTNTWINCNDNKLCTTDYCSTSTGNCVNQVNCEDNNACTLDRCDLAGNCEYIEETSCPNGCNTSTGNCVECTQNLDCLDDNLCTTDTCVSNSCVHTSNCPLGCWKTATGECYRGLCEGIKWSEIQRSQICSNSYVAKLLPAPQQTEEIDAKCVTRGEDTCAIDSESNCTMPSGTSMCFENAPEIFVCTTGPEGQEYWSRRIGSTACVTPKPYWLNINGNPITHIDLSNFEPYATVNLVLINFGSTGLTEGTFSIYESDYGEGLLNGDDFIKMIPGSIHKTTGNLEATWEIYFEDLNAASTSAFPEDNVYEFYFIATKDGFKSDILYADASLGICGDGTCDITGGENCSTCETDCGVCSPPCSDGIQNPGETSVDCGGSCPACEKEVMWTWFVNGYNTKIKESDLVTITVDNILDKTYKFRMLLNNATSENEKFSLWEEDTWPNPDDLIRDNLVGAYDVNNNLEYFWTPTMADFLAGGTGNNYEFYFKVDGETSSNLIIYVDTSDEITGKFPTCSDKIMNGDEIDVDCGGSCPDQDCVSVCFTKNVCANYREMGNCNADICGIAENSVPDLSEDETASCVWNESLEICNTKVSVTFNGIEIGSCIYTEDVTADNCDDGFLSYSWEALWGWDEDNNYLEPGIDRVLDLGFWHYDPQNAYLDCKAGSQTIPCPAQIQLNFFTWKNFFAAALLILIVYIILRNSKSFKKGKKPVITPKGVPPKSKIGGKKKIVRKKK